MDAKAKWQEVLSALPDAIHALEAAQSYGPAATLRELNARLSVVMEGWDRIEQVRQTPGWTMSMSTWALASMEFGRDFTEPVPDFTDPWKDYHPGLHNIGCLQGMFAKEEKE